MNKEQKDLLLGLSIDHLIQIPASAFPIHKEALASFLKLRDCAQVNGFDLQVISSFRSFDQQKSIWNKKASGQKTLLNSKGEEIIFSKLSKEEVLFAILRWSALPGFSRHHWGTDLDVYDLNSLPGTDYEIQLTPQEVDSGGIFYKLHNWLDHEIKNQTSFGFYRPYQNDLGGVAPEKWHLSYRPLSENFAGLLDDRVFQDLLDGEEFRDLLLIDLVKENSDKIFHSYIQNVER